MEAGFNLNPPQPDFAISVTPLTVDVPQGGTSSPVSVSITGQNGFSGSVQVTLTGLPNGVNTDPASRFAVAAGQSATTTPGQINVTAQGTSGSLSHSQTLALSVQAVAPNNLSKTAFVATDSVAALDNPDGEPRRRHIVYDSASQRIYVANGAMNRIDVLAGDIPALQTTIDAPGAASVD